MLWRMTWPSLRTNLLVDTPTLVVCGATGLPTSAPTEFSDGNRNAGAPSSLPTESWNAPKTVLAEVLLPDRATAIQPRIGASTMNAVPTLEKPDAMEFAIPE